MLGSSVETTSVLKCSVYIKLKDSRLRVFLWCMSRQAVIESIAIVYELTKGTQEMLFADWEK